MDAQFRGGPAADTVPPLEDTKTFGKLQYQDNAKTACEATLVGNIDKGFFIAEKEWTCYRRNYFSCACSFSLTPYFQGTPLELKLPGSRNFSTVHGFAVSISAVVADNDQHAIELIQHTPKRDKGPTITPPKVPLMAKQDPSAHCSAFYGSSSAMQGQNFPDGWVPSESGGNGPQTEWTFERIQFKQATQNNGKRRAAQQFYHIMVELWANIGTASAPNYQKIVQRKSAKMIVRGRSPGHYQNERGRSSNGPPSAGGGSSSFGASTGALRGFGSASMHSFGGYDTGHGLYDATQRHHHHHHHHALPHASPREAMIPSEDEKTIEDSKNYNYYQGTIDNSYHSSNTIEPWSSHHDMEPVSHMIAGVDINGKIKHEPENNTLPRLVHPSSLSNSEQARPCRPFEGRTTSTGSYPHLISPASMNMSLQ